MKKMLVLLFVVLLSAQVQAEVYNAGDDWAPLGSGTVNPNGQWSYLASDDLTNDNDVFLTPCIEYDANRSAYWGGAEMLWPLIWHSFTYSDGNHAVGDTILQAAYSAYTGPKYAKVRWTAPAAGTADISAFFIDDYAHATGGNLHGWVVHNDAVLFGTTDLVTESFFDSVVLAAGDTIDFVTATSGIGEPLGGGGSAVDIHGTTIDFVIPEPLTIALMGMGSMVILRKRS